MVYSQRDEEPHILANAPDAGRLLDVGAYTFLEFSNTRALFDRGWSGVLVEPSPPSFCGLIHNTKGALDRLTLVNAAATVSARGLIKFLSSQDAISTMETKHAEKWASVANYTPIWISAIPINDIIAQFGGKFEFINIDAEGISYDLLKAIDLDAVGCSLVCVEKDEHRDAMIAHLEHEGKWKVFHETAENLIAKRI